jgi:PIN domain nuclease of toxin-antitoxin system
MRILLDNQIALWGLTNDHRLIDTAKKLILESENAIFISVASLWEIAINTALLVAECPFPVAALMYYFYLQVIKSWPFRPPTLSQ